MLAAQAMAVTPVAVLMFRYNNPDAFLTLLLVAAAWALWSALETARTWKLVACGSVLGLAFTTKMLQALIVLPAFGLVYLLFGPASSFVVWSNCSGPAWPWWSRPAGGWPWSSSGRRAPVPTWAGAPTTPSSTSSSGTTGSPGFWREAGGVPGGGASTFAGSSGILRMFNTELGGQIAWLLPLALIGLVAGLWLTRRGGRTDLGRAGYVLWGGWALVTLAVFSEAQGIFHPYYTVALAPALAALAGAGSVALWRLGRTSRWWAGSSRRRSSPRPSWPPTSSVAPRATTPDWPPPSSIGGAAGGPGHRPAPLRRRRPRWFATAAGCLAVAVVLAGPAAYALTTLGQSPSGGDPEAGPAISGAGVGFGPTGGRAFGGPGAAAAGGVPAGRRTVQRRRAVSTVTSSPIATGPPGWWRRTVR